jgi:hypothetical protein
LTFEGELFAVFANETKWTHGGGYSFEAFAAERFASEISIKAALSTVLGSHGFATYQDVEHATSQAYAKAFGRLFGAACRSDAAEATAASFAEAFAKVIEPHRPTISTRSAEKPWLDLVDNFLRAAIRNSLGSDNLDSVGFFFERLVSTCDIFNLEKLNRGFENAKNEEKIEN